jgi:hypothetical protein
MTQSLGITPQGITPEQQPNEEDLAAAREPVIHAPGSEPVVVR